MRKKLTIEIFWIVGVVILSNLILYSILGDLLTNGRLLEIQNHDTFLIVPKTHLISLTFIAVLLYMYLLRWIYSKEINRTRTIISEALSTVLLISLLIPWLKSLKVIHVLGTSLYTEIKGIDRVQMTLLYHAALTLVLGLVALFDMTMGYKLIRKNVKDARTHNKMHNPWR